MKNIWKFMIVALMAIAMVGCPTGEKDGNGNKGGNSGTSSITYSISGKISEISTKWGGAPAAPSFSIMFLDGIAEEAVSSEAGYELKGLPAGSPAYQVQGQGNISFFTAISGTWKTAYDGIVAKVDTENDEYTLFVDTAKLSKTQLKGIGKDFDGGEKVLTAEDDMPGLDAYYPYALALLDTTDDRNIGSISWGCDLIKLAKQGTFPADAQEPPAQVNVSIRFTGSSHIDALDKVTFPDASADVEWTITGVSYYAGIKVPFNFYADNSGLTNEIVTEGATLTATLVAGGYDWEAAQAPADFADRKIAKKIKIGADEGWIAFDDVTGTFDWTARK